jgi:hypothetical protein
MKSCHKYDSFAALEEAIKPLEYGFSNTTTTTAQAKNNHNHNNKKHFGSSGLVTSTSATSVSGGGGGTNEGGGGVLSAHTITSPSLEDIEHMRAIRNKKHQDLLNDVYNSNNNNTNTSNTNRVRRLDSLLHPEKFFGVNGILLDPIQNANYEKQMKLASSSSSTTTTTAAATASTHNNNNNPSQLQHAGQLSLLHHISGSFNSSSQLLVLPTVGEETPTLLASISHHTQSLADPTLGSSIAEDGVSLSDKNHLQLHLQPDFQRSESQID